MERETFWIWVRRLMFLGITAVLILIQTLPLPIRQTFLPGPDLIAALVFAWTLRRPEVMSPILICVAVLAADFILSRPPGLWTLIILAGSVYLSFRQYDLQQVMFPMEWLYVSGIFVGSFAANGIILAILYLPQPDAVTTSLQALITILSYPIVTFVSARVFGISKVRKIEKV